jgi:multidrug efflux system outer membrane protein
MLEQRMKCRGDTPPFLLRSLALSLALSLLAGCSVGPVFEEPPANAPAAYRTQVMPASAVSDLKWWKLFQDPLLFSLVSTALENNWDLKIAASRIEQARASVGFVRADQFPRLDVEAGALKNNYSGGFRSPNTRSSVYLAAPLNWELDFWGRFSHSTAAARADLMASEYGFKIVQLTLISDVVANYYQLLDFHRRLSISENTLRSRAASLGIIEQRFAKGIISELDVNQAQIQKEIAAAAIPLYERAIARTENGLSVLLGRLPAAIKTRENMAGERQAPEIPVGMPSEILAHRPDVSRAKYLLQAQTETVGVAEALRFPSISLTGSGGVANSDLGSVSTNGGVWSVGGRLLGPVFDFNKNKSRVEIEEQKMQESLYNYENTVLTAFREVEDALVDIATYRQELAAVDRQEKAARNANMLSQRRYDQGVTSYLEVLDTERSLFSTLLQQSELQQRYLNAYVQLYKALGGGWYTESDGQKDLPAAEEAHHGKQAGASPCAGAAATAEGCHPVAEEATGR